MNSTSRIASGSPISARSITARNAGLPRARSIIVRSTSSTADGRKPTRCRALSIALYSVGKLTTPSARCAGSGASCSVSSRDHASVPSLPTSRCAKLTLLVGGVRPLALRAADVDVVAADAPQHLRHACARSRPARARRSRRARAASAAMRGGAAVHLALGAETRLGAVGQQRVDREHVVHHVAVGDRARAAGVVAGHAAERRLRRRADVDREPQAVRLQPGVELVEDDAGLDATPSALRGRNP